MKSIFISSTSCDLMEYRDAVDKTIRRLRLHPINMSDFGSQPGGAVHVSLQELRKADIFIGIVAYRYGYVPEGMDKSITEQEYDEAVQQNIPRLMYLVDPNHDWPQEYIELGKSAQMKAFRDKVESNEVRSLFTTPDNLAKQVAVDLAKQLSMLATNSNERIEQLKEIRDRLKVARSEYNDYLASHPQGSGQDGPLHERIINRAKEACQDAQDKEGCEECLRIYAGEPGFEECSERYGKFLSYIDEMRLTPYLVDGTTPGEQQRAEYKK